MLNTMVPNRNDQAFDGLGAVSMTLLRVIGMQVNS